VNVTIDQLRPGTFGVSHGGGLPGDLIRHATGSWAGHAFLYLGNGQAVQGAPEKANIVPADTWQDAIWAWRMWDQLRAVEHWSVEHVAQASFATVARGNALVGTDYDWPAYVQFGLEVMHLRNQEDLAGLDKHDTWRVCSALVADALGKGGVPLNFVPEDGPALTRPILGRVRSMPPNLVAPGMLLGLAQRLEWI
jgi:hypothetical protein